MKKFKAGTYKKQYGYRSFMPTLVGPFDWQSERVVKLLLKATSALTELNTYANLLPDVNFFLEMHKVKEAATSSSIEGTQTSVEEAVSPKNRITANRKNDWEEVRNYIDGLNHALCRLENFPLSMRLLRESHKILLSGVRGKHKMPGEIRTSQNWIGGADIASAAFVPPHPNDVGDLLNNLEKFWHDQDWDIPALIKIAITHYQFETIHPFLDGNGRIGRLLITLQLSEYKILDKPVLYLSDFFDSNRGEYYDSLTRVRHSNDMDHWLRLFLTGVILTSEKSRQTFEQIVELRKKYDVIIAKLGRRKKRAEELLTHLYSAPVTNARTVEEVLNVAPATANSLLRIMEEHGMLSETTGQVRNKVYVLHGYLGIFKKEL